jgi:regulatory protein
MKKENPSINLQNALTRLMELCSKQEKSIAEIKKKLASWGLESGSEKIIEELRKNNFINEERFTHAFINDKLKFNKWGKIKIGFLLQQHQIGEAVIQKKLGEIDENEYFFMISAELKKKHLSLKKLSGYPLKAKLYAFGQQRGYETDKINRYFEQENL